MEGNTSGNHHVYLRIGLRPRQWFVCVVSTGVFLAVAWILFSFNALKQSAFSRRFSGSRREAVSIEAQYNYHSLNGHHANYDRGSYGNVINNGRGSVVPPSGRIRNQIAVERFDVTPSTQQLSCDSTKGHAIPLFWNPKAGGRFDSCGGHKHINLAAHHGAHSPVTHEEPTLIVRQPNLLCRLFCDEYTYKSYDNYYSSASAKSTGYDRGTDEDSGLQNLLRATEYNSIFKGSNCFNTCAVQSWAWLVGVAYNDKFRKSAKAATATSKGRMRSKSPIDVQRTRVVDEIIRSHSYSTATSATTECKLGFIAFILEAITSQCSDNSQFGSLMITIPKRDVYREQSKYNNSSRQFKPEDNSGSGMPNAGTAIGDAAGDAVHPRYIWKYGNNTLPLGSAASVDAYEGDSYRRIKIPLFSEFKPTNYDTAYS
eukprot:Lankesteria_metandrocarpae@DN1471_c0_g1_i1.p1